MAKIFLSFLISAVASFAIKICAGLLSSCSPPRIVCSYNTNQEECTKNLEEFIFMIPMIPLIPAFP